MNKNAIDGKQNSSVFAKNERNFLVLVNNGILVLMIVLKLKILQKNAFN